MALGAGVAMKTAADRTFTVSQINQGIGAALQAAFPSPFWVTGEIQGYERDAAKGAARRWGQIYFELTEKEKGSDSAKATVKALVWGEAHQAILAKLRAVSDKLALQDGLQVRVLCAVDFYWPRASLQLKVQDVDPQFTLGDMERARQELLKRLKEEGLFDRNREVPMPPVPQTVGLITSDGSAAYHDFTDELKRSGYAFRVLFWDARMQGEETEESVCRGLKALEADETVDVIALIRGGGSRSDLIWFDKEKIALAVAACRKPVLTGIGHEIDLSVADLVAHESRKTPTAAAQFLVEKVRAFETALAETAARLREQATTLLAEKRQSLRESVNVWRGAAALLLQGFRSGLAESRSQLLADVRRHIALGRERLAGAPERLGRGAREVLRRQRERLAAFRKECDLKDPRRLLARGYSLILQDGRVVKSVEDTAAGRTVEAQVRDGFLSAKILSKRKVAT